jgi:hypothetical protein
MSVFLRTGDERCAFQRLLTNVDQGGLVFKGEVTPANKRYLTFFCKYIQDVLTSAANLFTKILFTNTNSAKKYPVLIVESQLRN